MPSPDTGRITTETQAVGHSANLKPKEGKTQDNKSSLFYHSAVFALQVTKCIKPASNDRSVTSSVTKVVAGSKTKQFSKRHLQISDGGDNGCPKFQFCPYILPKMVDFRPLNFVPLNENRSTRKFSVKIKFPAPTHHNTTACIGELKFQPAAPLYSITLRLLDPV